MSWKGMLKTLWGMRLKSALSQKTNIGNGLPIMKTRAAALHWAKTNAVMRD
jgi:hypothetical protein